MFISLRRRKKEGAGAINNGEVGRAPAVLFSFFLFLLVFFLKKNLSFNVRLVGIYGRST